MIAVFKRNNIIFFIICAIALAILIWFVVSRFSAGKIPSRGIFVMQQGGYNAENFFKR